MLRAARFAAKLDFSIAPETAAPIHDLGNLLADVPAARLFDESLKLFQSGYGVKSFEQLLRYDLLRYLFPSAAALIEMEDGDKVAEFIRHGLANTDQRIASGDSVTPMFLYGVFLWPGIRRLAEKLAQDQSIREYEAMQEAMSRIVLEQTARTALPKRFSAPMKEMLVLQRRFNNTKGVRAAKLLEHKRFRAAYDFLVLRSRCGEVDAELAGFWSDIQQADETDQRSQLEIDKPRRGRRRRSRRRPRRKQTDS